MDTKDPDNQVRCRLIIQRVRRLQLQNGETQVTGRDVREPHSVAKYARSICQGLAKQSGI